MSSRRDKFPGLPGEELPGMPEQETKAFDFSAYRAFGSVPRMLTTEIGVPKFESLDQLALNRVSPDVLKTGLFGVNGKTAVNGLAMGTDYHEAIIRNQKSFLSSIYGKTVSANQQTSQPRATEKSYRSQLGGLKHKHDRHQKILTTLSHRSDVLATLSDMQRTPGYHRRVSDMDVRMMATTAWTDVFGGMLVAVAQDKELPADELINMQRALSFRLLGGPQQERMKNWGAMLRLGSTYTHALEASFIQSNNEIEREQERLQQQLNEYYTRSGIGHIAVQPTVEM